MPEDEFDAYYDLRDAFSDRGGHQLLGHADFTQRSVEHDTVHAVHACTTETGGFDREKWEKVKDQVGDWRLLLQISTNDDLGMVWGDAGKLYFTIRRDGLAGPAASNTWFTFQH